MFLSRHPEIKVTFFEIGSSGGSVNRLINLLKNMDLHAIKVGVFSLYDEKKSAELLELHGPIIKSTFGLRNKKLPDPLIKVAGILLPSPYAIKYFIKSLYFMYRANNSIIYLNNTPYPHLPAIVAAIILKKTIVCHLRDTIELTYLEKKASKYISKFISLSKAAKLHYIRQGIPENKIDVIYDSINLQQLNDNVIIDLKCNVNDQVITVIIGSLVYRKGHDIVIKALRKVVDKYGDVKLIVIGDGEERSRLEKYVDDLNLRDNVQFIGYSDRIQDFLQIADIGILASRREGMPNVVMEYMAFGIATIVANITGINELIEDNISGVIIDQEDIDGLADKWINLIENKTLREFLGNNAKKQIENKIFSTVEEVNNVIRLIYKVS